MNFRRILSACMLAAICFADVRPVGMAPISQLFDGADLVVVGHAISVSPAHYTGGTDGHGVIKVSIGFEKFYKGAAESNEALLVVPDLGPLATLPSFSFVPGEQVLLFLKRRGGEYLLADRFYGKFRVSRLRSPSNTDGTLGLEQDLLAGLQDGSQEVVANHCLLLEGYQALLSLEPIRLLLSNTDPKIKTCAYGLLLRNSDLQVMPDLVRFINSEGAQNVPLDDLADGLSRFRNPELVPYLQALAEAKQLVIRLTAVESMRAIGDPAVIPTLIEKLNDADPMVRFQAVKALAAVAKKNAEYDPTAADFDKDSAKFLQLWEKWWTAEGKSEYP